MIALRRRHALRRRGATSGATAHLGDDDAQHDELAHALAVAERHDRSLVAAHLQREDVVTRVEAADVLTRLQSPQPDAAVT